MFVIRYKWTLWWMDNSQLWDGDAIMNCDKRKWYTHIRTYKHIFSRFFFFVDYLFLRFPLLWKFYIFPTKSHARTVIWTPIFSPETFTEGRSNIYSLCVSLIDFCFLKSWNQKQQHTWRCLSMVTSTRQNCTRERETDEGGVEKEKKDACCAYRIDSFKTAFK